MLACDSHVKCAPRQQSGNTVVAQDHAREVWSFGWLDTLRSDIQYGLRGIRRSPGFAMVVILSLALGIGANTAIFTLINAAMLTALPVSHPRELVLLAQRGGPQKNSVTFGPALWRRIHDEQDVFSSVAAYGATSGGESLGDPMVIRDRSDRDSSPCPRRRRSRAPLTAAGCAASRMIHLRESSSEASQPSLV